MILSKVKVEADLQRYLDTGKDILHDRRMACLKGGKVIYLSDNLDIALVKKDKQYLIKIKNNYNASKIMCEVCRVSGSMRHFLYFYDDEFIFSYTNSLRNDEHKKDCSRAKLLMGLSGEISKIINNT